MEEFDLNFNPNYGLGGAKANPMAAMSQLPATGGYQANYGFAVPQTAGVNLNTLTNPGSAFDSLAKYGVGAAAGPVANPGFTGMQKWLGGTNAAGASTMGIIPAATTIGSTLLNGFMGMKQYGLAKDQFKFAKQAYRENIDMQKKTLNTRMEDRARARAAADPTEVSAEEYMQKNKLR